MWPELEDCEPVASYAGLRPAGRAGVNYMIGPAHGCPALINVAAIRSTGLTASLGVAEHVCGLVEQAELALRPEAPLERLAPVGPAMPWWQRAAERSGT